MSTPRVVGRNEFEDKPPDPIASIVFLACVAVLGSIGTGIYVWNDRDARTHERVLYEMCLSHNPNCPVPAQFHR